MRSPEGGSFLGVLRISIGFTVRDRKGGTETSVLEVGSGLLRGYSTREIDGVTVGSVTLVPNHRTKTVEALTTVSGKVSTSSGTPYTSLLGRS